MDAYIVNPDAYTCLGHGEALRNNLFDGNCGLTPANLIYPDYFPQHTTKIGAINTLKHDESRLLQILRALGNLIPEQAERCELIMGASCQGDLEGQFVGDPHGCILHYLTSEKPELAPLYKGFISSTCSNGTDVLSMAALLVDQKKHDVIGILAVDCLDQGKLLQHVTLGTQGPDCAKPFDTNRNGTSFGEGGGFAIVANASGLEKLQAQRVYNIRGFGMSCDANPVTVPDENGAVPSLAISRALGAAELSPADIGYINAHASGTLLNDKIESIAYRKVFGNALDNIGVSGTKGAIGHLLGATGLVEAIVTCWSLSAKCAPGTVGLKDRDAALNIAAIAGGDTRTISRSIGMSTTFGLGSVNSAIVFEAL